MAKMTGIINFSGLDKSSNKVYVKGKNGIHIREQVREGLHKNEVALKRNYTTIGGVNAWPTCEILPRTS